MPTIKYPKNPNVDTVFVEQDDGTKSRALSIAPQDISTLELPNNPNSTKGYITVDGKKQRVILTADITGGGGSSLPDQTGHSGEFLTTDGTDASWGAISALQNTATGTNSLTILGTASSYINSVNIGKQSEAKNYSVIIGNGATANWAEKSVVIGCGAQGGNTGSVSIGFNAMVANKTYSMAIGASARVDGKNAILLNASGATQNNNVDDTFNVANTNGNFEIMSADGTIPTARLTKVNTTVTLTAAGWSGGSQTVTVTGMTATGVVLVSPDPTDQSAYTSAGIICTAQAADSLTFTATTTPSADIDVNVVML